MYYHSCGCSTELQVLAWLLLASKGSSQEEESRHGDEKNEEKLEPTITYESIHGHI